MKMVWWKPNLIYTKELVIFVDMDSQNLGFQNSCGFIYRIQKFTNSTFLFHTGYCAGYEILQL